MTTPNLPDATPLTPDVLRAMGWRVATDGTVWFCEIDAGQATVSVGHDGRAFIEQEPEGCIALTVRTLGKLRQILAALEEEP